MSGITIGTCSLCGGPVVSEFCHSIIPIPPRCANCGAEAAMHGPVVPMQPSKVRVFISTTGTIGEGIARNLCDTGDPCLSHAEMLRNFEHAAAEESNPRGQPAEGSAEPTLLGADHQPERNP